jgi:AraC-like DNA-binding protein
VYTPAISLLYFFRATDMGNIRLVKISFVISFIISLFTPTDYYIPALNKYAWGYMGQGGIAFLVFGIYAASVLLYLIIFFIREIRVEKNHMIRLKLKYITASFLISGILSIMNYPAIVGIDLYPPGNFSFIPLSFLAYGVLRHRLLDFSGIFQIATIWGLLSAVLTLPNIVVLYLLYPHIERVSISVLFIAGILWFLINYNLFRIVHQYIEGIFNKRKIELMKIESDFIESIYSLKTFDELVKQFTGVIKKAIPFETAGLVLCENGSDNPPGFGTKELVLSPDVKNMMLQAKVMVDRDSVEYNESCGKERDELLGIFNNYNSKYIVPLIQHNNLIALLMLSVIKGGGSLTPDEILFIKNVKSATAISLVNSIMYGDLNKLKDNLNSMVEEKTAELEKSMEALQGVVDSLEQEVQEKVVSYFARKKLEDTIKYIEENYHEEISRESLAKMTNMNSDYLGRMFKKLTDRNIADYINDFRLKKACELLINTDDSIVDIAFAVGFESLPTFYRVFKKTIDDTPVNYRMKYKVVSN